MKKLGDKIVSYLLALGMLVSCCSSGLMVNAMSMDVASSTDATTTITEETTDETDITTEDVYSLEITSEGIWFKCWRNLHLKGTICSRRL